MREEMKQTGAEPSATEILGAVARGWCHELNASKVMDVDLAIAIAAEVSALYATSAQLAPLPAREPLTAARLLDIAEDFKSQYTHGGTTFDAFDSVGFARAIEAAHGITATTSYKEQQ